MRELYCRTHKVHATVEGDKIQLRLPAIGTTWPNPFCALLKNRVREAGLAEVVSPTSGLTGRFCDIEDISQ
jgi:hypothetical protein